ncbi:MAG: Rpn family recombination-promoting nuclease/putative transposase [gamma proteobacterium symbiont of Bathyaustriella thionipta]|nr:Rpn family recombination-promoting nuclease/putative transposase [gamma proteobacterium symbiont of Bathyaustriella thionipta]
MAHQIKATSDFFIRFLFGSEHYMHLLLDFINAVLQNAGLPRIAEVQIMNPFNLKTYREDKESILDIKAKDENNRQFHVEIQVAGTPHGHIKRMLYYWARIYQQQMKQGSDFRLLHPVVCINLLSFNLFNQVELFHLCFLATAMNMPGCVLSTDFQIHTIEIFKTKIELHSRNLTRLEKWVYFFLYIHQIEEGSEEMTFLQKDDPVMREACDAYKSFIRDPELVARETSRAMFLSDQTTNLNIAREEGLEKGLKKGLKKGMEKGVREHAVATARKMKTAGMDAKLIEQFTGLAEEQIGEI